MFFRYKISDKDETIYTCLLAFSCLSFSSPSSNDKVKKVGINVCFCFEFQFHFTTILLCLAYYYKEASWLLTYFMQRRQSARKYAHIQDHLELCVLSVGNCWMVNLVWHLGIYTRCTLVEILKVTSRIFKFLFFEYYPSLT